MLRNPIYKNILLYIVVTKKRDFLFIKNIIFSGSEGSGTQYQ
jgi:hypothetical protein